MDSIITGKLIVNEFGNGFININDNKTIYISKKKLNGAFNGEIVEVEYHKDNDLYFGHVINYSLIDKIFIGKVDHFFMNNIYIYCNELGKSNLISVKTFLHLNKNDWLKVKIISNNNNSLIGNILEVLPNDIDTIIQNKYKLDNITNNEEEYNEEEDFSIKNLDNYIDQTHLDTFTIDPLNSTDCDDAFSIEPIGTKYNIFVHISDVSYYINPTKPIFNEVMTRGNTFYGKNKNWPMIPSIYSNNICSILPNKKTRVVTNHFIYDPFETDINKRLIYVKHFYSYVISKNKYDYDYVDNKMDNTQQDNTKKNNTFNILYTSSLSIQNIINDIDISLDTKSHIMIKYWMIYVNQIMCNEVKTIYRYNPIPSYNKFELFSKYSNLNELTTITEQSVNQNRDSIINFIKNTPNKLTFYLTKTLLTKAFYSKSSPSEIHYGIGINNYTHWTSPIRRSCDLLNHCILRNYYINDNDIERYIKYMNEMEIIQDNIENFIIEFNMYENIKINDLFEGTIIGINKTGINIYIEDLDNKFSIHISKLSNQILTYDDNNKTLKLANKKIVYKLFDKIKVKVSKIDTNKIDFIVI
jgi:ribonuclease R